jgi:hypothetical protein
LKGKESSGVQDQKRQRFGKTNNNEEQGDSFRGDKASCKSRAALHI